MKDSWQGKSRRYTEVSCWECAAEDIMENMRVLVSLGWRKINGRWHCPACAEKKQGRVKKS